MKSYSILYIILWFSTTCLAQERYSIVIDEIMADPSPAVGLPGNEWIELKNTSNAQINLKGWRIGDLNAESGPLGNFFLEPDSFVVLCPAAATAAMALFGKVISVSSFPSLDNDGDLVFLKNADGTTIHALRYNDNWHTNEMKKEGGWTLEMIDPLNPCTGPKNWKSSIHNQGGTPATINSIDDINADESPPTLLNSYSINESLIVVRFNEPIDSLKASANNYYSIDGGLLIAAAIPVAPLFDEVELKLNDAMKTSIVYTIGVNSVTDCSNNPIAASSYVRTGMAEDAAQGDLLINEILFNARPNAYDYVELYNNSNKIIDASKVYIANRNSSGQVSSIKALSQPRVYIFPGDYFVITEDGASLQGQYLVGHPENILLLSTMPSFPDDAGDVIILNEQGEIVDEVNYKDDWHFKLVDDPQGVALERLDPSASSDDPANWHSAASTAGYGTPTYQNSQFIKATALNAMIQISPKMFSPDNDGFADIAIIQYKVKDLGFVANVTVFDDLGRPVRNLVRNDILGLNGYWNWDGLDNKGMKLPVGPYIILTELFNLRGKKERIKSLVVLSRRL